jgi:hypothetical protein
VWSYDFVQDRSHDGRPLRMLAVPDEYTRERLAILAPPRLNHEDVLCCIAELMISRRVPEHMRSNHGSEFTARAVRSWLIPALAGRETPGPRILSLRSPKASRCGGGRGRVEWGVDVRRSRTQSGKSRDPLKTWET